MVSADECESYSSGSSEDDNVSSSVIPSRFTSGFESVEWQKTIENVVKSVVAIRFAQVASFDCDSALVSEATGFVVDAENGIIMTNRHVVGSGPFCGFAVFDNHEEIDVKPIYRDPVHDFGFLQFNPKDIKYMKVSAITLRPDLAKVGCEIRVVGNDAGEKLSILSGFISRLDRNAPDYGFLTYNDFNTEYIQAAASASGGSSGSPVVNMDGFVVALQAGGSSEASTDFFLPLNRGLRALECVQQGKPITRGTIQCQWLLKPFDECRRLGLTSAAEDKMRTKFPNTIGLLLAETVLPEGPSDGLIEEGDCLLEINGEPISKFIRVDEIFDSSVGEEVELLIQRGGIDRIVKVKINDLHAITPDRYVEVAGASFHNLSYQLARLYAIAAKGVYICEAAGSFKLDGSERKGWILDSVDDIPVPDLDTFIEVMKKIPDCKRIPLRYRHIRDLHSINYTIAYINRHWNDTFRLAIRNDETGLWDFTDLGKPLPEVPLQPQIAKFPDMKLENINCASLVKSFVRVSTSVPIKLDGFPKSRKTAYGLVVDAEKGYVVVSRVVVPNDLCDISITIAESVVIPGKVVFLHPLQNYAIVSYDPSLVIAPIQSATLSTVPLKQGTPVIFMGYNHNLRVVATSTRVTDITAVTIPPNAEIPRYRAINVDAITADTTISGQCGSGVLADEDGTVRALWLTYLGETSHEGHDHEYKLGIDITTLQNVIQQLKNGIIPKLRFLDIEVYAIHMVQARIRGVTEEWIRRVEEDNNEQHQLFNVLRVSSGPSAQLLEEGDILLAVNGKVMTRLADLDIMYDKEEVEVMIVRNKQEMIIKVPTVSTEVHETDRVVSWCGTLLQRPHHAVRQQIKKIHSGVYVVGRTQGSPAFQYSIAPTNFITHVNGQETPDLDKFLEVVSSIPDNTYAKLRIVTFDNVPFACSIKTNYHYFPTGELVKNHETGEWEGYSYKDGKKVSE
ncbi:Pro-apoptotic serine protease NMA111 [Nadsonia fulvescens var. elongata DSM 6958]|uniref:Pro-apoptotic serine protease NMA111 n=1 Tax=Nadsonia fulvescens var. elongata DSM 6958 TaxID=857566 RepID=A0A1E3PGM8_9ASCO|nr:Pro-apoptotic serine protease NMA111 [Nadsonia fulvescens var. elongata DSM 6958]